jgi:hypothetical protein
MVFALWIVDDGIERRRNSKVNKMFNHKPKGD